MGVWIKGIGFLVCPKDGGRPTQFVVVDPVCQRMSSWPSFCAARAISSARAAEKHGHMVYRAAYKAASREFKAREAGYHLARQIERAAKRGVYLHRAFSAYARVAPPRAAEHALGYLRNWGYISAK